eukprot:1409588-Prymnesium_polylepis.1
MVRFMFDVTLFVCRLYTSTTHPSITINQSAQPTITVRWHTYRASCGSAHVRFGLSHIRAVRFAVHICAVQIVVHICAVCCDRRLVVGSSYTHICAGSA